MKDDNNHDIYSEEGREELMEDDEISPDEEGFMEGASGLGQGAKCRNCGKILKDYKDVYEQEIKGELCLFCSKACSEKYLKGKKEKR